MSNPVTPTPLPRIAEKFSRLTAPTYRVFDWLFGSRYNPLYRSGTLAVGFLLVLLITGIYLSFFYSVSRPYESTRTIESQILLGHWVRALHRYATVACVISTLFHILQLCAQGKTWGPRVLAWVSGVVLLLCLLVSAWSGYVMVWDQHGQLVAMAGGQFLAVFPALRELVDRSFGGSSDLPPGFFFMNLFMHVAVPLLMVLGLWIHTAKLSRAVWFPSRTIFLWSLLTLFLASVLFPAPLLPEANLLQLVGRIPLDISTGFWIPWIDSVGVTGSRIALIALLILLTTIPWIWRPPSGSERPVSRVDEDRCSGCTQCARDCPYEAISMIPRADGKRLIALVNPKNCVSCGICAASCADFAIGPPGRSALDQRERVASFNADLALSGEPKDLTVLACTNNRSLTEYLERYCTTQNGVAFYPVECCGCVHSEVLEQLLEHSKSLALLGCPARNCLNRDGGDLLAQRVYEKRVPFLDRSIDRARVLVASFSGSEVSELSQTLTSFRAGGLGALTQRARLLDRWIRRTRATVAAVIMCGVIVATAQWPIGKSTSNSIVRLSGLLPSFTAEKCRPPDEEDLLGVPAHMRPKEICDRVPLQYGVHMQIDQDPPFVKTIGGVSNRVDRALYLNEEHVVASGSHRLQVRLTPVERGSQLPTIECSTNVELKSGQILLVQYNRERGSIECAG